MTPHEATRTLVKSPPEVWAQCSDAEALERHLSGSFGEIRITRLEPETAVAWEGEQVRGTVRIEPSAWGTRVTMTAQLEEAAAPESAKVEPEPAVEPPAAEVAEPPVEPPQAEVAEPPVADPSAAEPPPGFWARLRTRFRAAPPPPEPEPEPELPAQPPLAAEPPLIEVAPAPPEPEPDPTPPEPYNPTPRRPAEVLNAALDSLGQAHHRPFSRA